MNIGQEWGTFKTWTARSIAKNYFLIIIVLLIIFAVGFYYLLYHGCDNAETFRDNILVEIFAGGLFTLLPLAIYLFIIRDFRVYELHETAMGFANAIRRKKERGDIDGNVAQDIIVEYAKTLDKELLNEPWHEANIKDLAPHDESKPCGICGKTAEVDIKKKCKNCRLHFYAWK